MSKEFPCTESMESWIYQIYWNEKKKEGRRRYVRSDSEWDLVHSVCDCAGLQAQYAFRTTNYCIDSSNQQLNLWISWPQLDGCMLLEWTSLKFKLLSNLSLPFRWAQHHRALADAFLRISSSRAGHYTQQCPRVRFKININLHLLHAIFGGENTPLPWGFWWCTTCPMLVLSWHLINYASISTFVCFVVQ